MEKRLKEKLIDLILNLEDVPNDLKKDFLDVVKTLKRKEIVIPENARGKQEVCDFIVMLFCNNPQLMTPSNKILVESFSEKIGLTSSARITVNRNPRTRGG